MVYYCRVTEIFGSSLTLIQVWARGALRSTKAEVLACCEREARPRRRGRKVVREGVTSENLFSPEVLYECWVENDDADPAAIVEGAKC